MEMAETVVISFLSKAPTHQKVRDSSAAVDNYVLHGRRANAHSVNHVGTPFGSGLPGAVTNAFEEYMLAHELGHISLGHVTAQQIRYHSPRKGPSFEVVEKNEFKEFQADLWAIRMLLACARNRRRSDSDIPLAVGGISLGLGTGLLVEAFAAKHGIQFSRDHPAANERLYMAQVAYELFGAHEDAYVARRFDELLEEIVKESYPDASLPPMLARDLNQKMIQVLDSLGIDYSKAPYIKDFT